MAQYALADEHAVGVLVAELLAFDDLEQAAQFGLLVGLTPLADDGRSRRPLLSRPEKYTPHHRIDLGVGGDPAGDLLGLVDQEALR